MHGENVGETSRAASFKDVLHERTQPEGFEDTRIPVETFKDLDVQAAL